MGYIGVKAHQPTPIIHAMFLKAGALSLALLLVSRLLGLLRESAQAAAFGASGLGDVVVLMLTLPDWLTGVLASGALAYVLVPAWAGRASAQVVAMQRVVAWSLLAVGGVLALLLIGWRLPALAWLARGLPAGLQQSAAGALIWSALALPAALLAALWSTRLQHERDFAGMYGANLVVNGTLIAVMAGVALSVPAADALIWMGAGLMTAMLLRLFWLRWRMPLSLAVASPETALPRPSVWAWAALSAGLPLALPFAARSIASQAGEGALSTFNYAWKLVELPQMLAIQLVAALAFPAIAKAMAQDDHAAAGRAVRSAFALAFALACAAAAGLLVGAPALASLLFGWGRMDSAALARVAQWGALGAWGLLPQALIAVALTVLAARKGMRSAVLAYALALALLLSYAAWGAAWVPVSGARLMLLLNLLQAAVAVAVLAALGAQVQAWLPWRAMAISALVLLAWVAVLPLLAHITALWAGLALAGLAAAVVLGATWLGSAQLRSALAR